MDRRSHIFWYEDPRVSSDVLLKMLFHLDPQLRGLQRNQTADNLEFWTFPKDYEERLDQVMGELVQAAAARRAVEEDEANGVAQ